MARFRIKPLGYGALSRASQPRSALVPEAITHWLYDTATYTDNSTTELSFFTSTQTDKSLSNLEVAGTLPDPNFFAIQGAYVDFINNAAGTPYVSTAAGSNVGNINDIGLLLLNGRARFILTISDKRYGPWPLSLLHGTGAVDGVMSGTFTAEESLQAGFPAPIGVPMYIGGSIVIPPKVGFSAQILYPSAVDLVNDFRVRLVLEGVLYRRVS